MIPPEVIDQIKQACDIVKLVEQSVPLKRSGSGWKGLCPFHQEKTPSMHVSPQHQRVHCFGCGWRGDAIQWIQEKEGLTWAEAVKSLAHQYNIHIPESDPVKPSIRPKKFAKLAREPQAKVVSGNGNTTLIDRRNASDILNGMLWSVRDRRSPFQHWLKDKSISRESVETLRIQGRIGMRANNQLVFFYPEGAIKVRGSLETSHSCFWAAGNAAAPWLMEDVQHRLDHRTIFLTEGESDAMRLYGMIDPHDETVISMPSASWNPSPEMCYQIGAYRHVCLCFDGDKAGHAATERIAGLMQKHADGCSLYTLEMPDGEDVCSLKLDVLQKLLANQKPLT